MFEVLQLISGLSWKTEGEILLVNFLSAFGFKFRLNLLSNCETLSSPCNTRCSIVVLILPVLGDSDLTDELNRCLTDLVSYNNYSECAIVVIAQGDRHISDLVITSTTPFSVKVRHIFSKVGAFEILKTKLDKFTAALLAHEIFDLVTSISFSDILELNQIARLLPRAPKWCYGKRLIDFYDPGEGVSLLKSLKYTIQKRILSHIRTISPRILKMTYASLCDDLLTDFEESIYVEVIDLSSNNFSWNRVCTALSACRWLCLAANNLVKISLSQLPEGLEHLYLHKNAICEFVAEATDVAQIKSISLYRNKVVTFDWPAGKSALTRLNLGANPISSLPDTLADCTALEFLGLARTKISNLPEWIFSLRKLHELDISYIEDQIPSLQIVQLRKQHISLITRPGLVIP